jgi:hypothetical protein
MSCIDLVPTGYQLTDCGGYLDYNPVTTALLQDYALKNDVITFKNFWAQNGGWSEALHLEIEETATSSGNLKQAALRLLLFDASITAPSTSAANDPALTNHVATILIPASAYARVTARKAVATVAIGKFFRSLQNPGVDLVGMLLADQSVTYASSGTIRARLTARHHEVNCDC